MNNLKSRFLPLLLLSLFLSFSPSLAHNKPHHPKPKTCSCECEHTPPQQTPPQMTPPQQAPPQRTPPQQAPPKQSPPQKTPPQQAPPQQTPPHSQAPPKQSPPQKSPPTQAPPQQQAPPQKQAPPQPTPPQKSPPTQAPPQQNSPPQPNTPYQQAPPRTNVPSQPSIPSQPPNVPSEPTPSGQITFKGCFTKVFAFGGSYTDTGNAQALGGQTTGGSAATSDTSGNRFCNGRLVLDYLCDAFGLPTLPPFKAGFSKNFSVGANFAVSGSSSLPVDLFGLRMKLPGLFFKKEMSMNLQTQADWFNSFLQGVECKGRDAASCKADLENALFWIGATGVNEFAHSTSVTMSLQKMSELSVGNICKLLQGVLERGAKYVVVQGLPPVGCMPVGISLCPLKNIDNLGCAIGANTAVQLHNEILQKKIQFFQSLFPSCKIIYADYWGAYMEILKNPAKYNFQERFKSCCGAGGGNLNFNMDTFCGAQGTSTCSDPNQYMVWDGIHLTDAMNKQVTELLLHKGFCKPSFGMVVQKKLQVGAKVGM